MDLLFEIGTEELPPSYIRPALEQMSRNAARLLSEARIEHGEISTFGTPRRLVLIARDLAEQQLDVREKVFGPPRKRGDELTERERDLAASMQFRYEEVFLEMVAEEL